MGKRRLAVPMMKQEELESNGAGRDWSRARSPFIFSGIGS